MNKDTCLVIDFNDENTKLFLNEEIVDVNRIFDEKGISSLFRKIFVNLTFSFKYDYDGYEMFSGQPFDITAGKIKCLDNGERVITFSNPNIDRDNKITIVSKIKKETINDVVVFYKKLEDNDAFFDYYEVLGDMFGADYLERYNRILQRMRRLDRWG